MESFINKNEIKNIEKFFYKNGWEPLPYQIESWEAYLNGKNGIIQVPTGCGKTYAALMGPLSKLKDSTKQTVLSILLISSWLRQSTRRRAWGVEVHSSESPGAVWLRRRRSPARKNRPCRSQKWCKT